MPPPPLRQWLARDGHVHGPYELPQLVEMDAHGELLASDSFCNDGEERWISHGEWREGLQATAAPAKPKQTVIRPRAAKPGDDDRKTKKFKLNQPRHLASLPSPKIAASSPTPEPKAEPEVRVDPQKRLSRMLEAVNDHRRAHPHRHPFYFAEPQHISDVVVWLDSHHHGWDRAANFGGPSAMTDVMNTWFIPAMAFVKPDLVKPSHRTDFGEGRPWRAFE